MRGCVGVVECLDGAVAVERANENFPVAAAEGISIFECLYAGALGLKWTIVVCF